MFERVRSTSHNKKIGMHIRPKGIHSAIHSFTLTHVSMSFCYLLSPVRLAFFKHSFIHQSHISFRQISTSQKWPTLIWHRHCGHIGFARISVISLLNQKLPIFWLWIRLDIIIYDFFNFLEIKNYISNFLFCLII